MAVERLGQWRKGLPSISFPKWSRSAAAASSSKAKASPAVNLSGNDVELADFQSMTTRYDSGSDSEDLLSSSTSLASSSTGTCSPQHRLHPSGETQPCEKALLDVDAVVQSS